MNPRLPISDKQARMFFFGTMLAAFCLYGIERLAQHYEAETTMDPRAIPSPIDPNPYLLWDVPPGEITVNGQQVYINTLGSRGPDTTWTKAIGGRRVLALGDGVAFGEGVDRNTTFILDAVNALGGTRVGVETLLFATPGYSIMQQRNLMDLRGWDLSPDMLIINGPGEEMSVKPYVDKEVVAEVESMDPTLARLEGFAFYRILNHHLYVIEGPMAVKRHQVFKGLRNTNPMGYARVSVNDYAKNLDAITAKALRLGVEVVFVVYPLPEDIHDAHLTNRVGLYRMAMRDVAKRHGIPVVDGPSVFKSSGRSKERLFMQGRLLTPYGHRTLGYALAKTLRKWMRGRSILSQGTGSILPQYDEPEPTPIETQ